MYRLTKPLLFALPPEQAHHITMQALSLAAKLPGLVSVITGSRGHPPDIQPEHWGLKFPNVVGLAAGFDKNASYLPAICQLGFGHVEIGTLTPKSQPGNERPRLFRLPIDQALINRMGFNNEGVEAAVARLERFRPTSKLIIGGNIGKNKDTPNERAVEDYLYCFHQLRALVDYFVINVSSPNTPDLRALQERDSLLKILNPLQAANRDGAKPYRPLLVKIAPDLTFKQLDQIVDVGLQCQIDGMVISNTTIDRSGLKSKVSAVEDIGAGGLSGKPLFKASTDMLGHVRQMVADHFVLVGVGGIMSPEDAQVKLDHGANLVQIYTGLIFQGPQLVHQIATGVRSPHHR